MIHELRDVPLNKKMCNKKTGRLLVALVTRSKVDGLPQSCSSVGSTISLKRCSQVI